MRRAAWAVLWMLLAGTAAAQTPDAVSASDRAAVGAVLDGFHAAAAASDEAKYFAYLAPDAVFLGTDATERWTKPEFQAWAHPYFAKGRGWTYRSTSRGISFSADQRVAWFDELLENAGYGTCRGSGVLVQQAGGAWKITQYNLSIPIPNDVADAVVKLIRENASAGKEH